MYRSLILAMWLGLVVAVVPTVPAAAAPASGVGADLPAGCIFDGGVTTCITDVALRASITTPYLFCEPGNPVRQMKTSILTEDFERTTTVWRGLNVNDPKRLISQTVTLWTQVTGGQVVPYPEGEPCPV
jgi:hypothetical protein